MLLACTHLTLRSSRHYTSTYDKVYLDIMRRKLGILHASTDDDEADQALVASLMDTMQQAAADYTNSFRLLR